MKKNNSNFIFANSDAYNDAHFSEGLTTYLAGYKVETSQNLLDLIAPSTKTAKRFEYKIFDSAAFDTDTDDERTVGSEHKEVSFSGRMVDCHLANRGLTAVIDKDDMYDGFENETANSLKERLIRNDLVRALSVMTTSAGSLTSKKWMASGTGRSVPDVDLEELIASVGDECGVDANTIIMGQQAWNYRKAAMIASTAPGEGAVSLLGVDDLKNALSIENLYLSKERFNSINTTTGKKQKTRAMTSNIVFAMISKAGAGKYDPTAIKRFISSDGFKVYREDRPKTTRITVEHYSAVVSTGVGAVKGLSITNE